jgi:predicted dehydrogenase
MLDMGNVPVEVEMSQPLKAAVIGGSGFGKFHAQWYAREGAEVVAYTCTSDESVESAEGLLMDLTHQSPRGYADLDLMLRTEQPEVVSVCSPPALHAEPTRTVLEAGAHVLCEKPLVFDPMRTSDEILSMADAMLDAAQRHNRILACNLQYAAVVEPYLDLYRQHSGTYEAVNSYEFDMESKGNRNGPNRFEEIWIELGPHALTPLLTLLPEADLDESTLRTRFSETESFVEMEFVNPDRHRTAARLRTASCPKDATPVRRFGINGFQTDILARKDASGTFQTLLKSVNREGEQEGEDLMRISIRRFLHAARGEGSPLVTGEQARRNLAIHLKILDALKDQG